MKRITIDENARALQQQLERIQTALAEQGEMLDSHVARIFKHQFSTTTKCPYCDAGTHFSYSPGVERPKFCGTWWTRLKFFCRDKSPHLHLRCYKCGAKWTTVPANEESVKTYDEGFKAGVEHARKEMRL